MFSSVNELVALTNGAEAADVLSNANSNSSAAVVVAVVPEDTDVPNAPSVDANLSSSPISEYSAIQSCCWTELEVDAWTVVPSEAPATLYQIKAE